MAITETKEGLSFPQLYSEISGSTAFTLQKLLQMMAKCHDENEAFYIIHGDTRFVIPWEKIDEYFQDHEKPERPMGMQEEILFLRKEIERLKKEPSVVPGETKKKEAIEVEPSEAPIEEKIPARDPSIPKAKTVEEMKAELAAEIEKGNIKAPSKKSLLSSVEKAERKRAKREADGLE